MAAPVMEQEGVSAALNRVWGFNELRPLQSEVVSASLKNRDAVVVMPTGGGKSLCFQLPAIVTNTLTVVISPLIALMKDQVDSLSVVGVPAAALNSSLSPEEEASIVAKLRAGDLRLLYVSPERLLLPATLNLLKQGRGVARFAIDEAHCISAWGHDFRPEFRLLHRIKEAFPGVPVQAFTATATPKVQRDIAIQLGLERPLKFVGIFDRPNLTYRIVSKDDTVGRIAEAVGRYPDEGVIVYCLARKDTESIANALVARGISAVAYHAGLPNDVRRKVSENFAQEKVNVIVATVAFGMGIDRGNVRCVIHECIPKSMEGYQQETGRAGRDGQPSECVLLYSHGDVLRLKRLLAGGDPHHLTLLEEVRRFATSHECRHKALSEHFGQEYPVSDGGCGACDVCTGGMKRLGNSQAVATRILETAIALSEGEKSFGVGVLAGVLLGSRVKMILERGADRAPGFGAFASEEKERVSSWIHQMVDLGLLQVSGGDYPVLSVTETGREVLETGAEVSLIENVALVRSVKATSTELDAVSEELYVKFRTWRRATSAEKGVPAYVIFHDATLMRVASIRPSTPENLRAISGVGEKQAAEYGSSLLRMIREFAEETGAGLDTGATPVIQSTKALPKNGSYADHFEAHASIEDICRIASVKPTTVWGHLATWVATSKPKSIEPWIDAETIARVKAALAAVGGTQLKPVFEYLSETVPYDKIRVVRAFLETES
ncbi:RecQ Superfamily II DNA helicase [Fimbriimonadaceae bacterium]